MEQAKEFVVKYWPYLLGGIVGLFLIMRFRGGSSTSSGSGDYAAFMNAQAQAGQQNAALQQQQQAQQAQLQMAQSQLAMQQEQARGELQLNRDALQAQVSKDKATLDVQKLAVQADAFNNFTMAQAAMATAVGTSTAATIDALNKPALMAMQANAVENAANLQAAATVSAASFLAQGNIVSSISNIAGQLSSSIKDIALPQQQPSGVDKAFNYGSRAVAAYYTAGGSEAFAGAANSGSNTTTYSGGSQYYQPSSGQLDYNQRYV